MLCRQEGLDRKCSDKSEQQLSLLHHGKAEAQPYWLWLFRARRRNAGKRAGRAPVIGFLDGGGNQSFSYSLRDDRDFLLTLPKDHFLADSGLGSFLGLGRGLVSVWGCVLRTACANIS